MPHAYTEDQLVEQPAIGLFAELGWTTVSALEKTFGATGTLQRETKGEVVLVSRLRAAMVKADQTLQLSQKELITLGLLAQHEALTAIELVKTLELSRAEDLKFWVGRLKDLGVVNTRGKTKATEYFVDSQVLRTLEFQGETPLKGIERYRLRELILRDLEICRKASISEIHGRIGKEIPRRKIRRELTELVKVGGIGKDGNTRAAVYLWTK